MREGVDLLVAELWRASMGGRESSRIRKDVFAGEEKVDFGSKKIFNGFAEMGRFCAVSDSI